MTDARTNLSAVSKLSRVARTHAFASMTWAATAMAVVMFVGTMGYRLIGGAQYSWLDCFYMTFVTISTIGFSEIIDLSHHPVGRIFTMFIATSGIAILTFTLSALTAVILEGDLKQTWRRKKMQKNIDQLRDHYIVCGVGRVGSNVAHELLMTGRKFVLLDSNLQNIENYLVRDPEPLYIHGDATDNDTLIAAGILHARGVFAVAPDDTLNLVISLSARQLNPDVRIVARCHDLKNAEKTRSAGADEIVSPDFTGGLRLVSAMVRPHVVSFLDDMLKSDDNLRMEEIVLPGNFSAQPIAVLDPQHRDFVMLAVRSQFGQWQLNPDTQQLLRANDVLMVMSTPQARTRLETLLKINKEV
jgi:voltage-gated potassium channel